MTRRDASRFKSGVARPTRWLKFRLWSKVLESNASTLKDRTYEHQVQPMSGAKPVTLSQGYSTIAVIPETDSTLLTDGKLLGESPSNTPEVEL